MATFFNFPPTLNHLHPLQVENCDSNSRLVVDEDDNGKLRLERVKALTYFCVNHGYQRFFFKFKIPSFEYLCYRSTAIIKQFFQCGDFRREYLTSTEVRFWRLKSIPAL